MSNIVESLNNGNKIDAEYCVKIKLPVEGKAEIFGFVTFHDDIFSNVGTEGAPTCPPLGQANVIGDRIIFPIDNKIYRAPIFSCVSKPEIKYPIYLLYVPRLLNQTYDSHIKAYVQSFKNERPSPYIAKVDGVRIEDKQPFYFPKEDEYIFSSKSKLRGIGNSFVVITRRISKETGALIYEVYNPKDVEIINE